MDDPLSGDATAVARRMDPEDAVLALDASIATLNRHMSAMVIAKKQLEEKRRALVALLVPFEAELVQVF